MIADTKLGCALWAAVLAAAGCAPPFAPSELRRALPSAASVEEGARTPEALDIGIVRSTPGPVGIEFGRYSMRSEKFSKYFDDATYLGIRYSRELGLNWAFSLAAGYYVAEPSDSASILKDLEVFPLRLTLEMGCYLGATQSRCYLGVGGGYYVTQDWKSPTLPDLPDVSSEWTAHAVLGFEFRNETRLSTRIEGGHAWLLDSRADVWTTTGTLSYQF